MEMIHLKTSQFHRLRKLRIESGVFNSESYLYLLNRNHVKSKDGKRMVFKYLDCCDDPKIMSTKIYTVEMLHKSDAYQEIEELVFPEMGVLIEEQISGFALELIKNHINVGKILNDDGISLRTRLYYVIQLGMIIDKVRNVKNQKVKMQFGDFNEYNAVLDKNDKIRIIDLDSAYVGQDEIFHSSYYLTNNKSLKNLDQKYQKNRNGIYIPSDNTDLYCYNMIAIDALAKEDMFRHSLPTYYMYLHHLRDVGIDKELVKIFESIYLPKDNENPMDLLKEIDTTKENDISFETFRKEYQKVLKL